MRVTVLAEPEARDAASADPAAGTVTGWVRRRWVAMRTVDGMGRVRRETSGGEPVRVGDHIVAWTSPSVERAARARLPRALSDLIASDHATEPGHHVGAE
jgi:hypothetical protein